MSDVLKEAEALGAALEVVDEESVVAIVRAAFRARSTAGKLDTPSLLTMILGPPIPRTEGDHMQLYAACGMDLVYSAVAIVRHLADLPGSPKEMLAAADLLGRISNACQRHAEAQGN